MGGMRDVPVPAWILILAGAAGAFWDVGNEAAGTRRCGRCCAGPNVFTKWMLRGLLTAVVPAAAVVICPCGTDVSPGRATGRGGYTQGGGTQSDDAAVPCVAPAFGSSGSQHASDRRCTRWCTGGVVRARISSRPPPGVCIMVCQKCCCFSHLARVLPGARMTNQLGERLGYYRQVRNLA